MYTIGYWSSPWAVATPAQVLDFANYLSEQKYFEESFTAYERWLDMFAFPHVGGAKWLLEKEYLTAFQKRYEGTTLHRMRELYDRSLESCPAPEEAASFFLLYGKVEEKYGLTKRALGVYEQIAIYFSSAGTTVHI